MLRHTFIVNLFNKEQDLKYVQQQAGYASCRALHKYIIDNENESIDFCEACGNKILKNSGKRIESGQLICHKCQKYFK